MVARFINTLPEIDSLSDTLTPVVSPFPTLYDSTLDAAIGNTRLALLTRQLHYFLGLEGGVVRDGHHWIYKTFSQWYETFPWGTPGKFKKYAGVRRVVNRGRGLGVLVTRKRLEGGMDYRIDYRRLRAMIEGQGIPLPDWFPQELPDSDPVTLGMFIEDEIEAAVEADSMGTSQVPHVGTSKCPPMTLPSVYPGHFEVPHVGTCIKDPETTAQTTVTDNEQILAKRAIAKTEHLDSSPSAPVTVPRPMPVPDTLASLHHDDLATVQEFGDRLLERWRDFNEDDAPTSWADIKLKVVNERLVKIAEATVRAGDGPGYRVHPAWADYIFEIVKARRWKNDKPVGQAAGLVNQLVRDELGRQHQYRDLTQTPEALNAQRAGRKAR